MATKKREPPESIGRALNFAAGRMNALCAKRLEPHGLSLPQWAILSSLWREGPLTVSALAERVGTGVPAMSRILDRMEDRGLIARGQHESDGRALVVTVAEDGRALTHLADFHERINGAVLAGFSENERRQAFALLARMQRNAERSLS